MLQFWNFVFSSQPTSQWFFVGHILFIDKIGLSAHPTPQSYRINETVLYNGMAYFSSVLYLRTQETDDTVFESNIQHKNCVVTTLCPCPKPWKGVKLRRPTYLSVSKRRHAYFCHEVFLRVSAVVPFIKWTRSKVITELWPTVQHYVGTNFCTNCPVP